MNKCVLFIHGGGEGAYEADRLLAVSLQNALGTAYDVQYPQMPNEEDPQYERWKAQIETKLAALKGEVILLGHSLGGFVVVKYLSQARLAHSIAGLFLLAAPYVGEDEGWHSSELALPRDIAAKLGGTWPIFFYHSRDDEFVPFEHLALYAAKLPRATVRAFDGRGHQFKNDLADVAEDIKKAASIAS